MSKLKDEKDEINENVEEEKKELIRDLEIEQRDRLILPGNIMERNLGVMEAMPNVLSFFGGPTVIAITFAALTLSKRFWVVLICLAILFLFVLLLYSASIQVGKKYHLLGGNKFINRPIKKNLFQFLKLLVFLLMVSFIPTVLSNVELESERLRPVTGLFLLVYFIDLIATKIIRYAKDEIFYDLSVDRGKKKLMNYLELLVCLLSIIAYGLVIFPLAPRDYGYQIAIYFVVLLLLALIFTIVDNILLIRERKIEEKEDVDAIEDIEGVYYDEIERWRFISYFMFGGSLLLPFSIAIMIVVIAY